MKKILIFMLVILFLAACAGEEEMPTPTPPPTSTPTPTQIPVLFTDYLPDPSEISTDLEIYSEEINTNENIAAARSSEGLGEYEDILQMLEDDFGRIIGKGYYYSAPDYCESQADIHDLYTQVVLMKNAEGARSYHNWIMNNMAVDTTPLLEVGDQGSIYWEYSDYDCEMLSVWVDILTNNLLISIGVGFNENRFSRQEIETIVIRYAEMIEKNLEASPPPTPTSTPISPTPIPPTPTASPTPVSPAALEEAILVIRGLDYENLESDEEDLVNQAVQTIIGAGSQGAVRLEEELAAVNSAGEDDVDFQLLAAYALWNISGVDEAENIASIWSAIDPSEWTYKLLFIPGVMAASTQDPRVLPMLEILLSEKDGRPYAMLGYPLTHEFVWGAYGSGALPVLHEKLKTTDNPVIMESAITQLSRAQYLPALPEIREAINSKHEDVRTAAVLALGLFGHPDDFELLIAGLDSSDPEVVFRYTYALVEMGDLRAVPYLIPMLRSKDESLRGEAAWAMGNYLASPEGLNALMEAAASTTDEAWAEKFEAYAINVLESSGYTWDEYQNLSDKEQEAVTEEFRRSGITLKEGEQALTTDEFLELVTEWREVGYLLLGSATIDELEIRHLLPAAKPDNINLLLDAKASFYTRISDECIYDARFVDELIKWIGRSRYQ